MKMMYYGATKLIIEHHTMCSPSVLYAVLTEICEYYIYKIKILYKLVPLRAVQTFKRKRVSQTDLFKLKLSQNSSVYA